MTFLEKSLIAFGLGIVSWIIKDLLIKSSTSRNEAIQNEWKYRLTEIWSPLFYWSGIITLSDTSEGWQKHGIKELENILVKGAHLLPRNHYYILIKMIEGASKQKTSKVNIEEVRKTREYIYKQIELLNYMLYKSKGILEPKVTIDILAPYRFFLRAISVFLFHLLIWVTIVLIIIGLYLLYSKGIIWLLVIVAVIIIAVISIVTYYDIKERINIHKEIKKRLKN
ncbi:MAG TPA: hypothetical protein VMW81_00240 [Nitrospinota bacterium]|nr:hypothetical protein [Nitrospinota bacterium]